MGLFKEAAHYLEEQAKLQIQVYPDAADAGIPVTSATSSVSKSIADALNNEFLFGGLKKHRNEIRTRSMISVRISIYLPWENVGNKVSCTRWDIMYTDDLVRKVRFFSFNPRNVVVDEKTIWGK